MCYLAKWVWINFILFHFTFFFLNANFIKFWNFYSQYELWCGGDSGFINIYPIKDSGVSGHIPICHWEDITIRQKAKVFKLFCTSDSVYSCLKPGFTIYQWKLSSKIIQNKLDCSKLFPCSESISIEEQFNFTKCQVCFKKKLIFIYEENFLILIFD